MVHWLALESRWAAHVQATDWSKNWHGNNKEVTLGAITKRNLATLTIKQRSLIIVVFYLKVVIWGTFSYNVSTRYDCVHQQRWLDVQNSLFEKKSASSQYSEPCTEDSVWSVTEDSLSSSFIGFNIKGKGTL